MFLLRLTDPNAGFCLLDEGLVALAGGDEQTIEERATFLEKQILLVALRSFVANTERPAAPLPSHIGRHDTPTSNVTLRRGEGRIPDLHSADAGADVRDFHAAGRAVRARIGAVEDAAAAVADSPAVLLFARGVVALDERGTDFGATDPVESSAAAGVARRAIVAGQRSAATVADGAAVEGAIGGFARCRFAIRLDADAIFALEAVGARRTFQASPAAVADRAAKSRGPDAALGARRAVRSTDAHVLFARPIAVAFAAVEAFAAAVADGAAVGSGLGRAGNGLAGSAAARAGIARAAGISGVAPCNTSGARDATGRVGACDTRVAARAVSAFSEGASGT